MIFASFGRLKFYSAVQAELKAQFGDQSFVNRVCQTDAATKQIMEDYYPNRAKIPGPKKMRHFVVVCEVLTQRLELKDLEETDLSACAKLLRDRYHKVTSNPHVLASIPNQVAHWDEAINLFESRASK